MPDPPDFQNWTCPLPLRDFPKIVMGHGGGGKLSSELVEHLFLPAFRNDALAVLGDATVLPAPAGRLAFSTDSFVVRPLFFPGGSIGHLAVNGTVNDLAMAGAHPLYLSAAFILEEGLAIADLSRVVDDMATAARNAGVQIVTGDTKVVERGHGDGLYINTAGVGVLPDGLNTGPGRAEPGDAVLLSGQIGDHGMAIMSVREGLAFESPIVSDSAPLHELAALAIAIAGDALHVMRDPTRGGITASLNEIARSSKVGVLVEEFAIPVRPEVRGACEILGLDPMGVANEGKMLAFVAGEKAEAVLTAWRAHPLGAKAARIGTVTEAHPGMLLAKTVIGAHRVVPLPIGENLPRIC